MSAPISTDAHFQAWVAAGEERRIEAHAALIGTGAEQEAPGEGRALNISTAAARAGTSRTLLYRALSAGALCAFVPYPGANQRITERELARWLSRRKAVVS